MVFDAGLFLRTSGAGSLTETQTSAGVAVKGTPGIGMSCVLIVPKQSVGDTLAVKLQHSTDDVTYTDLQNFDLIASTTVAITTSSKYVRRFATEYKYVRSVATALGTSPDFGAVVIAIGDRDQWNSLMAGRNTGTATTV